MLDENTTPYQTDDLPKPPPGRHSHTRPAGPPEIAAPRPVESLVPATPPVFAAATEPLAKPKRSTRAKAPAAPEAGQSVATDVGAALAQVERVAADRPKKSRKAAADPQALAHLAEAIAETTTEAAPKRRSRRVASTPAPVEVAEPLPLEPAAEEPGEDSPATPHRRRRRGGRRRRRGTEAATQTVEETVEPEADADAEAEDAETPATTDSAEDEESAAHRRRRRRRRRGEEAGAADDDPAEVVVRVREPRRRKGQVGDDVSGIDGSTRIEAKRQRRKDGRTTVRRAPILTEAEFLARRESVDRVMVIRQRPEYSQIAVLEDGVLVEHYVDRASAASLIGSIYLGKVQNVLPSMEAAFIDIGRGRNAVLYAGEIDWESYGEQGVNHKVEEALTPNQQILVQVSKDPVGAKGARLTAHISLPGRYVVYSPDGQLSGISRKLPDTERLRLKDALSKIVGDQASVIVRTAAEGASPEELVRDVERLKAQWEVISKKVVKGGAPQQLYTEPDLMLRIVRDLFTEDFRQLVVCGIGGQEDAGDIVEAYLQHVAPNLVDRLVRWDAQTQGDPFAQYRVDEQIAKALERKVFLPSGGSLVIDRTEAMTVIDVNTGKFTGSGGNLEETVTRNNLEAAEEIVRQLRLRDLGGIIVVDFIDMVLASNRELLLRRLVECLSRDRTRHQVSEVTSLGLVQMTRKKIGTGLAEAFTEECETCGGRGYIRNDAPVDSQAPADGGDRRIRHSSKHK